MNEIRSIIAFFQALLPFIGFTFLAFVIYDKVYSPINIILALVIIVIGFFVSKSAFSMMNQRGVMNVLSENNSAHELNSMEPTIGDGVFKLKPNELVEMFNEDKLIFYRGLSVSIWGDAKGKKLDSKHQIVTIEYITDKESLQISFQDNSLLTVVQPKLIFYSTSYLKIIKAKEVSWLILNHRNQKCQFKYMVHGKEIKTSSNTKWRPHKYDVGIGMDALYIQG